MASEIDPDFSPDKDGQPKHRALIPGTWFLIGARLRLCFTVVFIVCSHSAHAQPSSAAARPASILSAELLLLPAEGDRKEGEYWDSIPFFVRLEGPRKLPQVPDADANLYQLADYWRRQFSMKSDRLPDALRERLLEACEEYPEQAGDLAHLVPNRPEAIARLGKVLAKLPKSHDGDESRKSLMLYLSRNSDQFRPELIARARAAYEGEGFIENEEDVRALARLDWNTAASLLATMPRTPRLHALVQALEYEHTSGDEQAAIRSRLRSIAEDRTAPAKARDLAIQALMATQWAGRDEWFISLLQVENGAKASDAVFGFSSLDEAAHNDPVKWIPIIAPLVESSNESVRANAISILVSFQQEESRADAAIPLLPWLSDAKWAASTDSSHDRRNLIYSLSLIRVPESIPGLRQILAHPADAATFEVEYAADALSQFHDERAVPLMRGVVGSDVEYRARYAAAKALIADDAAALAERVQAVVALARQLSTQAGRKNLNEVQSLYGEQHIDGSVVLGEAVIRTQGQQAAVTNALSQEARELESYDRETAAAIDVILAEMPDSERDSKTISAIKDGTVTAEDLRNAIRRAGWLCVGNSAELTSMEKSQGQAGATAAVLLGDEERQNQILRGDDAVAKEVLFAELRISGGMMPDDIVDSLTESSDAQVAAAAKAYAEVLWRMHHTL